MKGIRTFIAVFPPPEIQEKIFEIQRTLKIDSSPVRWEPNEKFHVTLKFLGKVSATQQTELRHLLESEVGYHSAFEVTLRQIGCFPGPRSPRVIWIGSSRDQNVKLVECAEAVDTLCSRAGFRKEERVFHPHITLGRVKGKISEDLLQTIESTTFDELRFPCSQLLVMKSDLSPSGSTFSQQFSISLNR